MNVLKIFSNVRVNGVARFKIIKFFILNFISVAVSAEQELVELAQPINTGNILAVIFGLLFVLILFFILIYGLKKIPSMQGAKAGVLRVIDTMYLGTNEKILLIQVGDQQLLIGVNSQNIETLHVLEESVDVECIDAKPQFKDKLSNYVSEKILTTKKQQ